MTSSISRRRLLLQISAVSSLAAVVADGAGAAECVDLKALDSGEESERKGLRWTSMTPNPDQPCAKCGFFTATTGGCGNCAIFNGPTYATGHCDSWSARS